MSCVSVESDGSCITDCALQTQTKLLAQQDVYPDTCFADNDWFAVTVQMQCNDAVLYRLVHCINNNWGQPIKGSTSPFAEESAKLGCTGYQVLCEIAMSWKHTTTGEGKEVELDGV